MQGKDYAEDMEEFYFKPSANKEGKGITEEQRKELKAIQSIIP